MDVLTKLYLLSLLDSLCFGLTVLPLPPYILSMKGNHLILGALFVAHNGMQQLSTPLIRSLATQFGKKKALIVSLYVSLFSHIGLYFAATPWSVVFVRIWFSLTNQTQTLCKQFVSEKVPKKQQDGVNGAMSTFGIIGFVIGPIVSGHLFDLKGITYISPLASFLIIFSIVLAHSLSDESPQKRRKKQQASLTKTLITNVKEDFNIFKSNVEAVDFRTSWNVIAIRLFYCSCMTIVFTKFVVLLRHKFKSSCTVIGYIIAYQSTLLFLSNFAVPWVKVRFFGDDKGCPKILTQGFALLFVALVGICFATTYDVYLLSIIPLAFSKTLLDSTWSALFKFNSSEGKKDLTKILGTSFAATNLTVPLVFGFFCDLFGHSAVKVFTLTTSLSALILAIRYKNIVTSDYDEKVKVDKKQ